MKNIIIQGLPGIGKTTLTKKIATKLNEMGLQTSGFYTEEVRGANKTRIGFDIVSLNQNRGILARKNENQESKYKVGAYNVYIDEFESIALPVLQNPSKILIVDEIGKMELFSKKFKDEIEKIIKDDSVQLIATVPIKAGPLFVQKLKENHNLITVTSSNRNQLLEEIIALLIK